MRYAQNAPSFPPAAQGYEAFLDLLTVISGVATADELTGGRFAKRMITDEDLATLGAEAIAVATADIREHQDTTPQTLSEFVAGWSEKGNSPWGVLPPQFLIDKARQDKEDLHG